jgi:hypothetical protein
LIRLTVARGIVHDGELRGAEQNPILGGQPQDIDPVITNTQPREQITLHARQRARPGVARIATDGHAILVLLFLVTVDRVHEIMGEVVPHCQVIADDVGIGGEPPATEPGVILTREAGPLCVAAVGRIQRAEAADQARGDRLVGLVGRGVPQIVVEHSRDRETLGLIALAIAQHGARLALIVG